MYQFITFCIYGHFSVHGCFGELKASTTVYVFYIRYSLFVLPLYAFKKIVITHVFF